MQDGLAAKLASPSSTCTAPPVNATETLEGTAQSVAPLIVVRVIV